MFGDFNADLTSVTYDSDQIRNFASTSAMRLVPYGPTHHTATSSTLLDLCLVDDMDKLISFGQQSVDFLSSHDLIDITYNIYVKRCSSKTIIVRDYSEFNIHAFQNELAEYDWSELLRLDDLDEKVERLNYTLITCFNKHAPLKEIHPRRLPAPWITPFIKANMADRDRLRRRWRRYRTHSNYNSYKILRNKVQQMVRKAKEDYYLAVFSNKKKPNETWKKLRQLGLVKSKNNISSLPFSVDDLNNFFLTRMSTGVTEDPHAIHLGEPAYDDARFYWLNIDNNDVINAYSRIKSKSVGDDGISLELIGMASSSILTVITHIFNWSLTNGVFPAVWKSAVVCPVPKTKNPTEVKHFRPISIISIFSKMFEHIVAKQMMDFLESAELLDPYQNAYRNGYSTQTALIRILDDIRQADSRRVTVAVFFDFSKAFDNVNYQLLINKLCLN